MVFPSPRSQGGVCPPQHRGDLLTPSPHGKQDAAKPQPPAGTRQPPQRGKWHLQVGLRGFLHGERVKSRSALNQTVP